MKILYKLENGIEIVEDSNGYLVRKRGWFWYWYAVYDFSGMYAWGLSKEYSETLEYAIQVTKNCGINRL